MTLHLKGCRRPAFWWWRGFTLFECTLFLAAGGLAGLTAGLLVGLAL